MRLRRRIQLLFVLLFSVFVAGIALNSNVGDNADAAADVVNDRLVPARDELQHLLTSLLDQETGQRGFLLTGEEEFLEPYEQGRKVTTTSLRRLRQLLADDSDAVAGVDRIRSRTVAWQQLGADFEIEAKRDGRGDDVVRALVASAGSKQAFDQIRVEVGSLQRLLNRQLADKERHVDDMHDLVDVIRIANVIVAFLIVLLVGRLLVRWVTEPLGQLSGAVRRAASGALRDPIEPSGPPDIAELAADVDAMRQRLLAEVDDAARARAALADRGLIVVAVRDDLAATEIELPAGLQLAARFRPAQGLVAGDWYDVARLDDDRVGFAVVDVSGHGAEVATFALRTKTLAMAAMHQLDPGEALGWLAEHIGETGELFLTGVIAHVSASTGLVRYASAGHPPMLLAGVRGVAKLGATGPLLGPLGGSWTTVETVLDRGGVLVAYSDGLIEPRDTSGQPFGVERVAQLVTEHQLAGVDDVATEILGAVTAFSDESGRDDVTLCVLGR